MKQVVMCTVLRMLLAGSASGQQQAKELASASTAAQIGATGPAAVAAVQAIQAVAVGKSDASKATTSTAADQASSTPEQRLARAQQHGEHGAAGCSTETVLDDEPQEKEGRSQPHPWYCLGSDAAIMAMNCLKMLQHYSVLREDAVHKMQANIDVVHVYTQLTDLQY